MMTKDEYYMSLCLEEAQKAYDIGEVPIGAVLVYEDQVIAHAHNLRETLPSSLAHAEILVIEKACKALHRWRLTGATLYVTIEPCPMCAGAIMNSRIDRVVYGSSDYKAGAVESLFNILTHPNLNHRVQVTSGVLQNECSEIMKRFFRNRRKKKSCIQNT